MNNNLVNHVEEVLRKSGVQYRFIPLPEDLPMTIASHMTFHGETMEHAMATIVYKTEKGLIAAVKRGDTQIDEKKLKKLAGVSTLVFATKEDLASLDTDVGLVPYVGLPVPYFVDRKILGVGNAYGTPGAKTLGMVMDARDIVTVNKGTVGDFTVFEKSKELLQKGQQRVFSGTRATGRLHLGNYLGAVKGYIALQERKNLECIYMAVDLHTITTPYDAKTLPTATRDIIMDYLAAGLDPKKAIITAQSLVPEHTYLAFLFSSVISVARMQHLPTFKEKVKQHSDYVTMALLNYPVLMAADILIYKAGLVPVGIDQEPHLEVAREIARKMNEEYGTDFPEPQRFATTGEYVPSLAGEGKMSKSVEGSSIQLVDDLDTIKKRLASAPTDGGQGDSVPTSGGVANLLKFVELFQGVEKRKEYEREYTGSGIKYKELKEGLVQAIYTELKPIQEKRKELEANPEYVDTVIQESAAKARIIAGKTVAEVKNAMGLVLPGSSKKSALSETITIDEFARVEQRVGKVVEARNVEGSEKLIRLKVDFGDVGTRIIFTGVRPFGYTPQDFQDKQFFFVVNLAPRRMMGEESQGMILAVDSPDKPLFVSADGMPLGAVIR